MPAGVFSKGKLMMSRNCKLTLAVIVKDEADLLAELLRHHQDLYDEVVVVDTGSTDNSVQVAEKAGARLFHFPWVDDFSAARNHALDNSSGNWIIQLDCDERIDPVQFPKILELIEGKAECCHALTIHNYTQKPRGKDWLESSENDLRWSEGSPGYWKTQPVRLFPNHSKLRYSGVIHENLASDQEKLSFPTYFSDVIIHHTGLLSKSGRERRDQLYGPLLVKKVQQKPNDLRAIAELATFLVGKNQLIIAEKLMIQGFERALNPQNDVQANLLMVEIQARLGKQNLAVQRLEKTIKKHPQHLLCWIQAVVLNIICGNRIKANAYLEQARKLFPASASLIQLEVNYQDQLKLS